MVPTATLTTNAPRAHTGDDQQERARETCQRRCLSHRPGNETDECLPPGDTGVDRRLPVERRAREPRSTTHAVRRRPRRDPHLCRRRAAPGRRRTRTPALPKQGSRCCSRCPRRLPFPTTTPNEIPSATCHSGTVGGRISGNSIHVTRNPSLISCFLTTANNASHTPPARERYDQNRHVVQRRRARSTRESCPGSKR